MAWEMDTFLELKPEESYQDLDHGQGGKRPESGNNA